MRGYFGLGQLSATDKTDILDQHKSVYNGYQTMQPQVSNRQPLYVYDDAGDKDGFVVNNRGEIKKYTNMGINEGVNDKNVCESCGGETNEGKVCEECSGGMYEEQMCESCGGETNEGKVCEQCGGTGKKNIQELGGMDDGHPRFGNKKFPNKMSPEEIDDLLRGDEEDYNDEEDYKDRSMYSPYYGDKNFNFDDEDDNDDEDVDYINLDEDDDCELEENELEAYDFESNGPNSGYNVNELEDNTINSYEPMQSAFDDDDDNDDDDDDENYSDDDDDDYDEDDGSETVPSFNTSRDMDTGEDLAPSFDSDGNFLGMVKPNQDDMEVDEDLIENRELEVPVKPGTKTPTKPKKPGTPYSPKPGPKKNPKARKGDMPDWLSFDELGIDFE